VRCLNGDEQNSTIVTGVAALRNARNFAVPPMKVTWHIGAPRLNASLAVFSPTHTCCRRHTYTAASYDAFCALHSNTSGSLGCRWRTMLLSGWTVIHGLETGVATRSWA